MVADLLLVLGLGVFDDLWNKRKEDVFKELEREDHLGPVMALLHRVKDIAWGTEEERGQLSRVETRQEG